MRNSCLYRKNDFNMLIWINYKTRIFFLYVLSLNVYNILKWKIKKLYHILRLIDYNLKGGGQQIIPNKKLRIHRLLQMDCFPPFHLSYILWGFRSQSIIQAQPSPLNQSSIEYPVLIISLFLDFHYIQETVC